MYPERDSRADEFDDAVRRRQSGDNTPIDDPELRDLVDLATQLEQTLPDDIPDPVFRENLKHELTISGHEPAAPIAIPPEEPADLEQERWYRRLVATPWRASAAAAACLVIIVVAFMATASPFDVGSGDSSEEITTFQPVGTDDNGGARTDQFLMDGDDDSAPPAEQWFTASFPPLDVEHVVLPPLLIGFLPLAERSRPEVALNGATDMVNDIEMPGSESVYYLNAPPDGATMLTALGATLGVEGELVEGNGEGNPYRFVDEDGNDIMRWDMSSAFFHFQGAYLDDPVDELLDPDATIEEVARRFLELIGFDLHNIEYDFERVDNESDHTEVRVNPIDFPDTGLGVSLGGSVFINDAGAVLEAQLYWLSLVDIEVVSLREPDAILEDLEHDYGYAPPAEDADEVMIAAEDIRLIHVLTRLGDSNFVLQPAVKVVGDFEDDVDPMLPGPARYLIPAVKNNND